MSAKKSYNKRKLLVCANEGCDNTFWTFKGRFCDKCRRKDYGERYGRGEYAKDRRANHNRVSPVNLLGATGYDYAAHVLADLAKLKEIVAPCIEQDEFMARLKSERGQRFLGRISV